MLFENANDKKHKSYLKDYCKANNIKHSPYIPESDCAATFKLKYIKRERGDEYILSHYKHI